MNYNFNVYLLLTYAYVYLKKAKYLAYVKIISGVECGGNRCIVISEGNISYFSCCRYFKAIEICLVRGCISICQFFSENEETKQGNVWSLADEELLHCFSCLSDGLI